jgi:hypothetical protein
MQEIGRELSCEYVLKPHGSQYIGYDIASRNCLVAECCSGQRTLGRRAGGCFIGVACWLANPIVHPTTAM